MITTIQMERISLVGKGVVNTNGKYCEISYGRWCKTRCIIKRNGEFRPKEWSNYVRNDFYLATAADIVADPSAPNAFVQGIMEGKEGSGTTDLSKNADVADIKETIEENHRKNNAPVDAFAKFLQKL